MEKPNEKPRAPKRLGRISRWGDYILARRQSDGSYVPDVFKGDGALVIYGDIKDAEEDRLEGQVIIKVSIPE